MEYISCFYEWEPFSTYKTVPKSNPTTVDLKYTSLGINIQKYT